MRRVCCLRQGTYTESDNYQCGFGGGTIVGDSLCQVCCLSNNNATMRWPSECGGTPLATGQCESICCSNLSGLVSRFTCQQSGGYPVTCPLDIPR